MVAPGGRGFVEFRVSNSEFRSCKVPAELNQQKEQPGDGKRDVRVERQAVRARHADDGEESAEGYGKSQKQQSTGADRTCK